MKFLTKSTTHAGRTALLLVAAACVSQLALAATPNDLYISHVVKQGDTLEGLTRKYLTSPREWHQVAKLNGMKNPGKLSLGQVINIPKRMLNFKLLPIVATPGKVITVDGDVRMGGVPLLAGASIPEGAKLQTGTNSSAIVQLGDGSRVQLMPKTLAEVTTQRGYAMRDPSSSASTTWFSGTVRLVSGVIDTLANKGAFRLTPLEVVTPTSLVGIRGTHFRVAYEDPATGVARTEVLEGKVRTDNTAQKVGVDVGGGFGAALNPREKEIKVVALLPALPESTLASGVLREREGQRNANWAVGTLPGAVGYRVQLASDAQFSKLNIDVKSPSPSINLAAVSNGTYYARVRGFDASGIEGYDTIKLIKIDDEPVKIVPVVLPKLSWVTEMNVGATADYVPEGIRLKVFTKSTDSPNQLTVQVANDAGFSNGLQSLALAADGTVVLRNVPIGKRSYVRFVAQDPQRGTVTSPTYAMDISDNWGTTVLSSANALELLQ